MEKVSIEKKGHIAILTINYCEKLNALNREMFSLINNKLDIIDEDKDIYVLIITGTGKAFVSGADINEMVNMTPMEAIEWEPLGTNLNVRIENLRIPVIAAVNGVAYGGGCELAMACDLRIASENAEFCHPEVSLGIIPGFGGSQRLPRIIGAGKAKEMIYTGMKINADEAYRIKLVNKVVPYDELINESIKLAEKIAVNAQIAVQEAKKAITKGMEVDKITGLAYETQIFALCFATEDQKIGMGAFVNKSKEKNFIYK